MKASLLPLEGKYYGTVIYVSSAGHETTFEVWDSADYQPSDRELARAGVTRQQYDDNAILSYEDFGGEVYPVSARERCEVCDSHFESQWTYELAKKIVAAINDED